MSTTDALPDFAPEFRPRWPGDPGGYNADQMREVITEREALRAQVDALRAVAEQVLRDMQAQGLLWEWQTTFKDAIDAARTGGKA